MSADAPTVGTRITTLLGPQANVLKSKYAQWRLADIGNGGDGAWARFKEWASSPDQGGLQVPDLQNAPDIKQDDIDQWAGVKAAPVPAAAKTPDLNDPASLTGVSAEALQLIFNNTLAISNNAMTQLNKQGLTPVMKWDANAYGKGIGGFVPTQQTVPILDAAKQQFDLNRTTMDQLARVTYQTGKVPRTALNAQGMIELARDANGQPIYDETVESRNQRTQAGMAIGAISSDLLAPPRGTTQGAAASSQAAGATNAGAKAPVDSGAATSSATAGGAKAGGADAGATGGQDWAHLDDATRQLFVGQWGDRYAQARWEYEAAKNAGQDPGAWEAYAAYRGVPILPEDASKQSGADGQPDTGAALGNDAGWSQLGEPVRQGFVNQWGDKQAQARWEWENAQASGADPGAWEDYAQMRGASTAPGTTGDTLDLPALDTSVHGDGQPLYKRWLSKYIHF